MDQRPAHPISWRRRALTAAALLLGLTSLAGLTSQQTAYAASDPKDRSLFLTSFDGTQLYTHFFPADGLTAGHRAPTILLAHGFGEAAPSTRDAARLAGMATVGKVLHAGYNVVTWDARGHGSSGGMAMVDSPDYELRDVEMLIDWIAKQPEVQLDGPGDPRMGMNGASYGGIIQYLVASHDHRVDAIAPGYTAYSLTDTTLREHGKVKDAWILALTGIALTNIPPGLQSPLGPQLHLLDPDALTNLTEMVATDQASAANRAYLDYRSPSTYLNRVNVPTLVIGGTSDGLFPLVNAVRDFRSLKSRHVPVKLDWNCEGHSQCPGSAGPLVDHFDKTVIAWFDRWVKRDRSVKTGAPFHWIADNEASYRSAGTFPPAVSRRLVGVGSGTLPVAPVSTTTGPGFVFIGAQPAVGALEVPIPAPSGPSDVVGFPHLTLTYTGTALPARTWLYGQILDNVTGRVVGVQVTPIPVNLDGAQHTVSIDLNPIATRATSASRYTLQLMAGSVIFGDQRSTGAVTVDKAQISLPVINPRVGPRLSVSSPKVAGRTVAVRLRAVSEPYRGVGVVLQRRASDGSWRTLARTGSFAVGLAGRTAYLMTDRALTGGRYRVVVHGEDAYGRTATTRVGFSR
jgi:ABC-2 type transport system ATP-binding protein